MYDGVFVVFLIFGTIAVFAPGIADYLSWLDHEADNPWKKRKYKSPNKNSLIFTRILGIVLVVASVYYLFIRS